MKYRGSTIEWSTTFQDAEGADLTPDIAVLRINFPGLSGGRESTEIDFDIDGSSAVASWNSSEAGPGKVRWSIRAVVDDIDIADDGEFCLSANLANDPSSPAPARLTTETGIELVTEDGEAITV